MAKELYFLCPTILCYFSFIVNKRHNQICTYSQVIMVENQLKKLGCYVHPDFLQAPIAHCTHHIGH
jgi:hypothetical protein